MTHPPSSAPEEWPPQLWTGKQNIQPYTTQDMPTNDPSAAPMADSFNLEDLPMTVPISKTPPAGDQNSSLHFYPDLAKGPSRQSWDALLPGAHRVGFSQGLLLGDHLFQGGTKTPKHKTLGSKGSHEALQASLAHSIVEGSSSDKDLEQSSVQALHPGLTQQMLADPADEIDRQREKNR